MGDFVEIGAADGHRFKAYRAQAKGDVKGTVIIAPEIFGVNNHIRSVADTYAAQGYFTLAPQLFDRSEPDYEAGYEQTDVAAGIAIIESIEFDEALRDLAACVAYAQGHGKVAVVGYCWGGTIAWLAAASTEGLSAAVAYYGGGIHDHIDAQPQCPTLLHFAEKDTRPDLAQAQAIAARHSDQQAFFYPAGHGFNCNDRAAFDADSAALAFSRTMEFLGTHVAE